MTSHRYAPPTFRNGLVHQAGRKRRNSNDLPPGFADYVPVLPNRSGPDYGSSSRLVGPPYWQELGGQLIGLGRLVIGQLIEMIRSWRPKDILGIPLALTIIWLVALWWGEEAVFRRSVEACAWDRWESWPTASTPHHVVLVADPQLVDPHTYPGRPWPLSSLTVRYTDLYMRKSFQQITQILAPDSVFFLGDLFDGGREWTTDSGYSDERESPEKRWRKYDSRYWIKEYGRFSRIFFDPWLRGESKSWDGQRKLVAGLPGNHDLGLGNGIRIPVRKRFQAYFGNGNRIDLVGNHTFVSLDTVSLSAKGQPSTEPGTAGIREGEEHNKDVWGPVDHFLHTANAEKSRTIDRELRVRYGFAENEMLDNTPVELDDPRAHRVPIETERDTEIPSVVLTHVPFYRAPGTPCGPLRERYPPHTSSESSGEPPEKDDANSIKVQAGEQYQNVLTQAVSNEIVDLVRNVTHVFSGDDHDYCDVIHHGYTSKHGGIREITVKSISWAMGIRTPGFLLLSLWNPVVVDGKSLSTEDTTIQTQLCLLPDQLSIFIRYGLLLAATLLVLLVRAVRIGYGPRSVVSQTEGHLLPLRKFESSQPKRQDVTSASTQSSSAPNTVSVRASAGKSRAVSSSSGYGYAYNSGEEASPRISEKADGTTNGSLGAQRWNDIALDEPSRRKRRKGLLAVYDEFRSSILQVASVVLMFYAWLLLNS